MKYSFLYNDCIYTYEINETNKEEILEKIKEYATEEVVEENGYGPYGIEHQELLGRIKKFYDEILEYQFKEGQGNERYGGNLNVRVVALVKKYPVLYNILKDNHSLSDLLAYMKGDVLIRKAYRSNSVFQLVRSINEIKKDPANTFNYDKKISFNEKVQILQEYLSGLQFHLVKTKSLEKIKTEIDMLKSIETDEHQQALITKHSQQLKEAQRNTEVFKELCQLSDLEFNDVVEDAKRFTKRK